MIVSRLRTILADKRISITQLSQKTGIPRATLTLFADDKTTGVRYETLNKISIALGVQPADLFLFVPYDVSVTVDFSQAPDVKVDFNSLEDSTYRLPCVYRLFGANGDVSKLIPTNIDVVVTKKDFVFNQPYFLGKKLDANIPPFPDLINVRISQNLLHELRKQLCVPEDYSGIACGSFSAV